MTKKKEKTKDGIYLYGQAAEDVTGSMYYVRFGKIQVLLECGLYQSSNNSYLDAYRVNSRKFQFDPAELNAVFVCHAHIDHTGLLPRLVKEGFRGDIIMTSKTRSIVSSLLMNSSHIVKLEAKTLTNKFKRAYDPLYKSEDVGRTISQMKVYDEYNHIYDLGNGISFQWLKNSHCLGAAQLQLILHDQGRTRKIHYTSDLGALNTPNHYVDKTEIPETFSDVVLMESTYGDPKRQKKKTREFDQEHLKSAIETTLARNGSVIMPAFSFARTQELLTNLYLLFGNDPEFNALIYVDSLLSVEITKKYESLLGSEDLKLWNQIMSWTRLRLITKKEISDTIVANRMPKIVISSSGFCISGRIVGYLKNYLRDQNSMIIFSGYTGNNPSYLSWRIQNYKSQKEIKVCGDLVPNRANCMNLYTYSSHMPYDDLLTFGSSLNTNMLVLVHGSPEAKDKLLPAMKNERSKKDKTFKVLKAELGMKIDL